MDPFTIAMWVVCGVNPCAWIWSCCTFCICFLLIVFAGGVAWQLLKPVRDEATLVVNECIKEQVEIRTNKFQDEAFNEVPCLTLRTAVCSEDPTTAKCAQAGGNCACRLAEHFDSLGPQMLEHVGPCCREFDRAPKFGGFFQKADEMCHLHLDHVMSRMKWIHGNCTQGRAPYWHDDLFWSTDLKLDMPVHLMEGDGGLETLAPLHSVETPSLPVQFFEASLLPPLHWSSSRTPLLEILLSGVVMFALLAAVASTFMRQVRATQRHHESSGDAHVAATDEEEELLAA